MAWIEVHQSLIRHRKTTSLGNLLDVPRMSAVGHIIALWLWALDNTEDGDLTGLDPSVIAVAAEWPGAPEVFVDAAVKAGFLDRTSDSLQIHNWMDYAGKLVTQRRKDRERKRAQRMSAGNPSDVRRNSSATVPYRTLPRNPPVLPTGVRPPRDSPTTIDDSATTAKPPGDADAKPASKPARSRSVNRPVDEPFIAIMIARFGGDLGGEAGVREHIADAQAHRQWSRWTDKQRYVQNWLRREADYVAGHRNGTTPGPPQGNPATSEEIEAIVAEAEARAHERKAPR